jgi:CRISPR system Cascade subunit CasD
MSTLLLRLVGPMQAWGVESHFTIRDTGLEPSKSGVAGLLCAALGVDRADDEGLRPIAVLRMGVRVDREGLVRRDYHTAGKGGYLKANGDIERKNVIVSNRYFLADAAFLVGLEGDRLVLVGLQNALQYPVWPLCLGRKAFVPGEAVWLPDGLQSNDDLETALRAYRRLRPKRDRWETDSVRVVLEDPRGEVARRDQPLSFARGARQFGLRRMRVLLWDLPAREVADAPQPVDP